jgi:hypothetical protein
VTSSSGWWQVWELVRTRPLTYLTFWANYQVGGHDPIGYHVVNLLLHLASVWLLFSALNRLMPIKAAFIAAGIFAVHPIQSEAVNYVFARSTLLMTFFCIVSLWLWVRGRHWPAVAAFALALLSKEECVAFPVFLFLLYLSISRNSRELAPIGVMCLCAVAAGLRVMFAIAVTPGAAAGIRSTVPTWTYLGAQGGVIWRYLGLLFWPTNLSVDPDVDLIADWWAWLALVLLVVLASKYFTRARAGFWFIAGLALLLPSSSVFTASDVAADRRMYLPMIAFAAAVAVLVQTWNTGVLATACLALASISLVRTHVWSDEVSLWADAVEKAPEKIRPRIQLARALHGEAALEHLNVANRLSPDDPFVAQELGRVYVEMNQPAKALGEFGRELALAPNDPQALTNRGVALMLMNQRDAAKQDFARALQINPCLYEARLNASRTGVPVPPANGCKFSDEQRSALKH